MTIDIVATMRVFAAVVDADSFAGAADKLDMSRGMVTRYVAQLEAHLGVRLLNRTTRKLSLTEAGSDYYQRAIQVLGMIEDAESSVAQEASVPRGTLRVTSSVAFGVRHLGWAIAEYLQKYPGVHVDVTLNDRTVDLIEEGEGLGSTFTVRLPLIGTPSAAGATTPIQRAATPERKRRVLVIEDHDDVRAMLCDALRLAGHEVHECSDGNAGIDAAAALLPEVALIDIGLPGDSGYKVAERIRACDERQYAAHCAHRLWPARRPRAQFGCRVRFSRDKTY